MIEVYDECFGHVSLFVSFFLHICLYKDVQNLL
jgi:hypothetical protein